MERTRYAVTFMGDHACGHRHPVKVVLGALSALDAIDLAREALADDRIISTGHSLYSVFPEPPLQLMGSDNAGHILLPCPFCANPEPKLLDACFDGEPQYYVNCGCCNASQQPDSKERAINDWNQRTTPEVSHGQH